MYRVIICSCEEGPYIGARKAGTVDACERCGFITPEQFQAIIEQGKPVYPKHEYDLAIYRLSLDRANERAQRWQERFQDSEKRYNELTKTLQQKGNK